MDDARALREALVDTLVADGSIRSPGVEAAFRAVPHHRFVDRAPALAYRNQVISTRVVRGVPISSASPPAIMAIMLKQLGLEPGQRVLEIGTGTGYNAMSLTEQAIADAGLGEQIARARRVLLELSPQMGHVHAQVV
jgi:protein-L-isoaspartate(D-aspartate) O-methyltransferase